MGASGAGASAGALSGEWQQGPVRCEVTPDRVPLVDICRVFVDRPEPVESLFVDSVHANAAGHALIADTIYRVMVTAGLTAAPAPVSPAP